MACGLGVCLSCTLPLKKGGRFKVCGEGPVADGRIINWEAM
jgi:dihydroorotate dehydrogenase electron transfer subunit